MLICQRIGMTGARSQRYKGYKHNKLHFQKSSTGRAHCHIRTHHCQLSSTKTGTTLDPINGRWQQTWISMGCCNTTDLTTAKILVNSISTGAKFFTVGVKNFCLNTPLEHFEYMQLPFTSFQSKSFKHTTYASLRSKGGFTLKLKKVCMAYHKWILSQTNCSPNGLQQKVFIHTNLHWDYGNMCSGQLHLSLL